MGCSVDGAAALSSIDGTLMLTGVLVTGLHILFFVFECFVSLYICTPHTYLLPAKSEKDIGTGVNHGLLAVMRAGFSVRTSVLNHFTCFSCKGLLSLWLEKS